MSRQEPAKELDGYSEADAAEAAKQIAYDCAKSVAHAGHPLKGHPGLGQRQYTPAVRRQCHTMLIQCWLHGV